jgi:RHS repeat-associated protein
MHLGKIIGFTLFALSITNSYATCLQAGADPQLCETDEILFSSNDTSEVAGKAAELGSPVKIYEYLRNNAEYKMYHGSQSVSLNTLLNMRGNDVDLATTLIAMLRSQNIKSRYVAGRIKLKKSELSNWLGGINESLAELIANNFSLNPVQSGPDHLSIDHVWVEALINYNNYRGGNTVQAIPCLTESELCKWTPLDASFKQKKYNPIYRSLLSNLNFDYDAYYNALNSTYSNFQDGLQNKNPLEIFEEQALQYLRINHPGITLKEVIDEGEIISENSNLIPSSLPYNIESIAGKYNSIDDFDLDPALLNTANWSKYISIKINSDWCSGEIDLLPISIWQKLATTSINKLVVSWQNISNVNYLIVSLGNKTINSISETTIYNTLNQMNPSCTTPITKGLSYSMKIIVDGRSMITVEYPNLILGGYHAIVIGGESSGWSQVHRAYQQLLAATKQYPIVLDVNSNIYIDENNDGLYDSSDTLLSSHQAAKSELTSGLLYAAQTLYLSRMRSEFERYSHLSELISPINVYLGIITTVDEVDYLGNIPFSFMPKGLLIDLKYVSFLSYESNQSNTLSNNGFNFISHIGSSLEHEIWQELTGFDAISTVHGFQLALSQGKPLLTIDSGIPNSLALLNGLDSTGSIDAHSPFFLQQIRDEINNISPNENITYTIPSKLIQGENYLFNIFLKKRFINQIIDSNTFGIVNYSSILAGGGYVFNFQPYIPTFDFLNFNNDVYNNFNFVWNINNDPIKTPSTFDPVSTVSGNMYHDEIDLTAKGKNLTYHLSRTYNSLQKINNIGPTTTAFNNPIVIGNHTLESSALVNGLGGITGTIFSSTSSASAITDSDLSTYIYGNPSGTANLNFNTDIYNHNQKTDLVFFFLRNNTTFDITINGQTKSFTSSLQTFIDTDGTTKKYQISVGSDFFDLTAAEVDLSSFGIDDNQTINNLTISLDTNEFLALASGLNVSPYFTPAKSNSLGKGWSHSYGMYLKSNDFGMFPNYTSVQAPENNNSKTSSITYVNERGGEINYLISDINNTWTVSAPKMNFDKLELNVPTNNSYILTFRNGAKYFFEGSDLKIPGNTARLSRIEDPYGNQLIMGYTGDKLTSVTDNLNIPGRTGLSFTYYPVGDPAAGNINTIQDWTGRTWTYTYNAKGQLAGVTNPLSETKSYTYHNDSGLLKDIIDPENRGGQQKTMTFNYYENDQAFNYIDQLGNEESLTYDLFRKRTRITNPRGFMSEHYYDKRGTLIKLVEPDNAISLFENTVDDLRYLKYDVLGHATKYSYNLARTLDTAASDAFGQVTREQDALGNTTDLTYGTYDQISDFKDKNNTHFVSHYYALTDSATGAVKGKLQRVIMPQAIVNGVTQTNVVIAEYQYNADGTVKHIEEMIDPATPSRKRITDITYSYNANGYTTTKVASGATSGGGVTTQQVYDSLWRLTSETIIRRTSATDATLLNLTTNYEYDALSRPVRVTDPLGNISESTYDKNGQIGQIIKRYILSGTSDRAIHNNCTIDAAYPTHHSCIETTRTFDVADRLKTSTNIDGDITTYNYDEVGNVTKITNALNHSLHNEYDSHNRLKKITNENGYSIETKYDLAGRVLARIDSNKNATNYSYDALGRVLNITTPEGRVTQFDQYDGNGNVIKIRDANAVAGSQPVNTQSASVYKQYDEFNRVISETNANNEITAFQYDLFGNLTRVTDALNHSTQLIYDDMGRLIQIIDPIIETGTDKTRSFTYDEAGNRLTATDRNGELTRTTYDALNRAILIEFVNDGTTQTATYNQYGELAAVANSDVTYNYLYDNQHRMIKKTDSRTGKFLFWVYDAAGNVVLKTDYQGQLTQYIYDSTNRLVAMENSGYLQASYHYDPAGRLLSRILSNGASTIYNYDKDGFVTKITQRSANNTVIDERAFTHDELGNITSVTVTGGETATYSYDPAYRLLSVDSNNNSHDQTYTYDTVGNRLSMTQNGTSYFYIYNNNGNRLNEIRTGSVAGTLLYSYDYDDNGSRIAKRNAGGSVIESSIYNQKKLITQQTINGNTINFNYDPSYYRITKTNNTDTHNYLLEGEHLEATYDANNKLKASYLRGVVIDEIINGFEQDINGKLVNQSYHHDQVNSVVATTDHNGAPTQTKAYSPFGLNLASTGNNDNKLAYTGRELDDESGLYYYRARYYDSLAGRFLSEDPLGFEAGVNFYAYVNNNPLNSNDPSGNCPWCLYYGGVAISAGARLIAPHVIRGAVSALNAGRAALGIARTETIIASGVVAQNTPALLAGTSVVADEVFKVTSPGHIPLTSSTLGDVFAAGKALHGASINFGAASMNTAATINDGIDFTTDSITSAFNSGFNLTSDFIQNDLPSFDSFLDSIPTIGTPGIIFGSELGRALSSEPDLITPNIPTLPSSLSGWQGMPYRK